MDGSIYIILPYRYTQRDGTHQITCNVLYFQLSNFLPSNAADFRTKDGVIVLYLF
jgi:hypothetical protein